MDKHCVPYKRKALYLLLSVPMLGMYIAIAFWLWQVNRTFALIYGSLFVLVALFQSYVCVHWRCPYIGKFAPCVGGFCLPSSQIARLLKNVKTTEKTYNIVVSLAFTCFLSIIVLPLYFLYQHSLSYLLIYLGIVTGYAISFLWLICPVCGTRLVCPGGQAAEQLRNTIKKLHP